MLRRGHAGRVDTNQPDIVAELRRHGFSVHSIATVGDGCPDLLVGFGGVTYLIEVKDGSKPPSARALTPDEAEWHDTWQGYPVDVLESVEQARAWALLLRDLDND